MNERGGACRCLSGVRDVQENDVPGARPWEHPFETEERKWVVCLMRRRPRILTNTEKRVIGYLYGITDETRRWTCDEIAIDMNIDRRSVHGIEAEALEKIGYVRPR